MKKSFLLILASLFAIFALSGCADDSKNDTPVVTPNPLAEQVKQFAEGYYKITFFYTDGAGYKPFSSDCVKAGDMNLSTQNCEDADIVIVSYGAPVRSVITATKEARANGKKVGYIKIDTPWPFPDEQIKQLTKNANDVLVVEMNLGQMYYEVDRAVNATANTHLLGVIGGLLPTPEEILSKIEEIGGN